MATVPRYDRSIGSMLLAGVARRIGGLLVPALLGLVLLGLVLLGRGGGRLVAGVGLEIGVLGHVGAQARGGAVVAGGVGGPAGLVLPVPGLALHGADEAELPGAQGQPVVLGGPAAHVAGGVALGHAGGDVVGLAVLVVGGPGAGG